MSLENVIYKLQRGLDRTFSKTEKSLKKLKKSVDKTKNIIKHYHPPKETYIGSHIKSDLAGEPVSNESYEKYYKDLI